MGKTRPAFDPHHSISSPDPQIRQLLPKELAARFGVTERWWQRYLPTLCKMGKIHKRGRFFFGTYDAVAEWLSTSDGTVKSSNAVHDSGIDS